MVFIDVFVVWVGIFNDYCCVYVDVVVGEVEGDKVLKNNGLVWESGWEKDKEVRSGVLIGDYVEDGVEVGWLVEGVCGIIIEGVEEVRYVVEKGVGLGVEWYVVEWCKG